MDLVDIIAEKRFLGQEFLTWLWFKSDERGGAITVEGHGDILVVFEKHLLLEYGEGESFEKVVCQGLRAELKEARTGLRLGKKLEQARLLLQVGEYEFHVTLKGSVFEYRSVRLPKTMAQAEDADDPAAREGMLLDRIGLYQTVVHTVDALFRMFLRLRLSDRWPEERERLAAWIASGAAMA